MEVSDKRIIKGIQQGGIQRERMFEVLMLQTQRLLHAYLIKQFNITAEEERTDIVTDSYLSLDKQISAKKFRGEATLVNYLHRIVHNKALGFIKRQKNRIKIKVKNKIYPNKYEEIDSDLLDEAIIEDCIQKALIAFKQQKAKHYQQLHQYMNCNSHEDWVKKYKGTIRSSKDRLYRIRKSFNIFYERFCGKRKINNGR
ncbi:RNA polymerase sigma factor [Lutibacter sp.]